MPRASTRHRDAQADLAAIPARQAGGILAADFLHVDTVLLVLRGLINEYTHAA